MGGNISWNQMPDKMTCLLIDTSALYKFGSGFKDPDFRKLLHYCGVGGTLKIFIPHIVWEERRTQLLDEAYGSIRALQQSFNALSNKWEANIVLDGLRSPVLSICDGSEIDAWSREVMKCFAAEHKIEIVPFAPDHADRAWTRYFDTQPPFNRQDDRKNRRKDIPDAWILEAAIDTARKHPGLVALVSDTKLADALKQNGIGVFNEVKQVLDEIEKPFVVEASEAVASQDVAAVSVQEKAQVTVIGNGLEHVLAPVRNPFKDLEVKVLGYVAYLGTPTKEELFTLLSQSQVSAEIARNVAERLAFTGLIMDTGNHYLVQDKEVAQLALQSVEAEIIKLLEEN
jgi:hypothetical protein